MLTAIIIWGALTVIAMWEWLVFRFLWWLSDGEDWGCILAISIGIFLPGALFIGMLCENVSK